MGSGGAPGARERARNGQSFVRNWQLLGPFPLSAADGEDAMAKAPIDLKQPQQGIDGPVRWARHDSETDRIGLAKFFGRHDPVVCYALCWVHAEVAREVNLSIGSDDGVEAWLGGTRVHRLDRGRGVKVDEDRVEIRLRAGWNRLLIKVYQGKGGWGLAARIADRSGRPMTDLVYDPWGDLPDVLR